MKNKIWFTADTHFKHKNIIRYCNRPFESIEKMDEAIIKNWNDRVSQDDIVYHLGDFALVKSDAEIVNLLKRLNGYIKFLSGNHDKVMKNFFNIPIYKKEFYYKIENLGNYHEFKIEDNFITLNHYAQIIWNKKHHGAWCLCGHSHYNLELVRKDNDGIGKILDVGVDGNNFTPYSYEEIKKIMEKKSIFPIDKRMSDHHEKK